MLKILYATGNRTDAETQLLRFLFAIKDLNIDVRYSGFKSNHSINLDWNLEALNDFKKPGKYYFDGQNLKNYYYQIKAFNPDLIISDFEIYSSHIGFELNKPVWQVSPSILYYGANMQKGKSPAIFQKYLRLFNEKTNIDNAYKNTLYNSDKLFIYSPFGDLEKSIELKDKFKWIRPYFIQGSKKLTCQHNVVSISFNNEKRFVNIIKNYKDTILFSKNIENFDNILTKDIDNIEEYGCNLYNCNFTAHAGFTDFLSDSIYNYKYSMIHPNYNEKNCIINALFAEHLDIGKLLFNHQDAEVKPINLKFNNIKQLHEEILCNI